MKIKYKVVGPDYGIKGCMAKNCTNFRALVKELVESQSIDMMSFHFYNLGKQVPMQPPEAPLFLDPNTLDGSKHATNALQ